MTHTYYNIRKHILAVAAVASAFAFAACDEVDNDDRFTELPAQESQRNVLIEEFTGQRCTNCPDAHRALAALSEQYGSSLIVVGIHAGNFGVAEGSSANYVGLMVPEGQEYADSWGNLDQVGYPVAGFNRTGKPATYASGSWDGTVYDELARPANLDIDLEARLNAAGEVEVTTVLKPYDKIDGKLQLWVVEDSITAIQIDHGKTIRDYVHNHVFRGSVNGTWGETVALNSQIDETKTASVKVKDNWNTDHLHIVAFVYNDKDGVLQAQKADVVK